MKTAGVITYHDCVNYGASLQAYATQKNLEKLGIDCKFIDYIVPTDLNRTKLFLPLSSPRPIRQSIKNLMCGKDFFERNKNFKAFNKNFLNISSQRYDLSTISQIRNENFDFYITGSDQTFALNLGNDKSHRKSFFFPFDLPGKKISYSSSMGENIKKLSQEDGEWISNQLSDYYALSVREKSTADYIEKNLGKRPEVLFDPTLTLTKEEWSKIEGECPIKGDYIFFYSVLPTSWPVEYVKKLSKETGLPVIASHFINTKELGCNFKRAAKYGPETFLSLIHNAKMVVTSSFHGTVFSMIYEKPFASLILGEGNRITTLLESANMKNFGFRENDEIKISQPDKDSISSLLEKARRTNEDYLRSVLK